MRQDGKRVRISFPRVNNDGRLVVYFLQRFIHISCPFQRVRN